MYAQIEENFNIFAKKYNIIDLRPEVVNITSRTNQSGVLEREFSLKIMCPIHIPGFVNSPCSYIEGYLSDVSLETLKSDYEKPLIEEIVSVASNQLGASPQNLRKLVKSNGTIAEIIANYSAMIKTEKSGGILDNALKFGKFSISDDRQLEIKSKKFISVKNDNRNKRNRKIKKKLPVNKDKLSARKEFKNTYYNMIKKGIDPILFFENKYGQSDAFDFKKGRIKDKPLKLNGYENYLESAFNMLKDEINTSMPRNEIISINKKIEPDIVLENTISLSEEKLKSMGLNPYLILVAKDKRGRNIQTFSYQILLNEILDQVNHETKEYDINGTRNLISGTTKVMISTKDKGTCKISLHAKMLNPYKRESSLNFNPVKSEIVVNNKEKVILSDGKIDNLGANPINYPIGKNILYRSTFTYKGNQYDNVKSFSINSLKRKNENTCFAVLTPKVLKTHMQILISNLSSNIREIRLIKFPIVNGVRGRKEFTEDRFGNIRNEFLTIDAFKDIAIDINDYDMFDRKIYEYILECKLKNGETKIAISNRCIEKFEARQNLVKIENITIRSVGSINQENKSKKVLVSFDLIRKEPSFKNIVSSLLGRDGSIFEQELSTLRNISSLNYSILIERFDQSSGVFSKIKTIDINATSLENNQRLSFNDNVLTNNDVFYKLTPRVKPTDELLRTIQNTILDIANNESNKIINYSSLVADDARRNLAKGVYSIVRNKYNLDATLKRGLIIPESIQDIKEDADLFFDASTGDIEYIDYVSERSIPESDLDLNFVDYYEIKENLVTKNKNVKKYGLVFESNGLANREIDFYAVVVRSSEDNIYLDGAIHSKDTNDEKVKYKYLITHTSNPKLSRSKQEMIVEYFLVPVTKEGSLLKPFLIHSRLIRE